MFLCVYRANRPRNKKNTLKNRVTDATAVLATGHQPEAVRPPAQPSLRAANCRLGIGKTDQAPLCHSTQSFFSTPGVKLPVARNM